MRAWIQNHFNVVMLVGFLSGLFVPGLEKIPTSTVIVLLGLIIFFSCTRITRSDFHKIDRKLAALFYLFRFLVIPAFLYQIVLWGFPDFAMGALLLALMPVGVTSTAIAMLTGGNPAMTLFGTIMANGLAPFVIPFLIFVVAGQSVDLDVGHMLMMLCLSIFVPVLLYMALTKSAPQSKTWIEREAQIWSILLTGGNVAIVIAHQRGYFFNAPEMVVLAVVLGCALYAVFYAVGWFWAQKSPERERQTFAVCSGVNNVTLSAALALLYFSPLTVMFCALAQIPWVLGIALFKKHLECRSVFLGSAGIK